MSRHSARPPARWTRVKVIALLCFVGVAVATLAFMLVVAIHARFTR